MAIKSGDKVRVHYTGVMEDGTEFDSSRNGDPLEFVMGIGALIPGFENALLGKEKGESVKVDIPAADGYGEREEDLIFSVPRTDLPDHIAPELGMMLELDTDQGLIEVVVVSLDDEQVTLDANHPLAGETLIFDIEVMDVIPVH